MAVEEVREGGKEGRKRIREEETREGRRKERMQSPHPSFLSLSPSSFNSLFPPFLRHLSLHPFFRPSLPRLFFSHPHPLPILLPSFPLSLFPSPFRLPITLSLSLFLYSIPSSLLFMPRSLPPLSITLRSMARHYFNLFLRSTWDHPIVEQL